MREGFEVEEAEEVGVGYCVESVVVQKGISEESQIRGSDELHDESAIGRDESQRESYDTL